MYIPVMIKQHQVTHQLSMPLSQLESTAYCSKVKDFSGLSHVQVHDLYSIMQPGAISCEYVSTYSYTTLSKEKITPIKLIIFQNTLSKFESIPCSFCKGMFQRQPLDLEAKLYFIENKMTLEPENVFIELGILQGLLNNCI